MFLKKNFLKSSSYIVFTIFVIFFICFINTNTFSKIFKIQDIEIEEPFNSNFNKEKVINKAFGEAFNILLNSLITSKDKNKIKNTQLKDIKYLIDSFTITNEQFLNKNYQANFEVNFDKPKILNFFEKKNIFPSMYKKKEFLTIIILIDNDEDKVFLFDRILRCEGIPFNINYLYVGVFFFSNKNSFSTKILNKFSNDLIIR